MVAVTGISAERAKQIQAEKSQKQSTGAKNVEHVDTKSAGKSASTSSNKSADTSSNKPDPKVDIKPVAKSAAENAIQKGAVQKFAEHNVQLCTSNSAGCDMPSALSACYTTLKDSESDKASDIYKHCLIIKDNFCKMKF